MTKVTITAPENALEHRKHLSKMETRLPTWIPIIYDVLEMRDNYFSMG